MLDTPQQTVAEIAAKMSPPVTVTGMSLFGYGLESWVYLATLIYTLVMTVIAIDNHRRERKKRSSSETEGRDGE